MEKNPLMLPSIFIVLCVMLAGTAAVAYYYDSALETAQVTLGEAVVAQVADVTSPTEEVSSPAVVTDMLSAAAPLVLAESESPVVVEYAARSITRPDGVMDMVSHEVLRVRHDGAYHAIFPEDALYTVKRYEQSPSGRYLLIMTGEVAGDAAVRLYVYDMEAKVLECVRTADRTCDQYNGFPMEESVQVGWFNDERLWIEFDNQFLPEGADEGSGAIGIERFESQSGGAPWDIALVQ